MVGGDILLPPGCDRSVATEPLPVPIRVPQGRTP